MGCHSDAFAKTSGASEISLGSATFASERNLVRWMRSDRGSVLVFVARSIKSSGNGYSPWVALNANVIIDTAQCEIRAYPTA